MLRVVNQTKDSAEIYITGTIIDDEDSNWKKFWNDGDTTGYQFPADLKRQLDSLEDKDLTIYRALLALKNTIELQVYNQEAILKSDPFFEKTVIL